MTSAIEEIPGLPAGAAAGSGQAVAMFAGHRAWDRSADRELARVPFGPRATALRAEARRLAGRLDRGAVVTVTGDASGWAAMSAAALLPDQKIVALVEPDGPLGAAGIRRWLAAADAPANLTAIADANAPGEAAAAIDMAALEPGGRTEPPGDSDPTTLHALIDPDAAIDLNRARIGARLLSDAETKALYWASRAASVARTAERMGCDSGDVLAVLRRLDAEGFVRLARLPAAMARLHVFWSTGEVLLPAAEQTLAAVARFGFTKFAERTFAHIAGERAAISYGDAAGLIRRTAAALYRDGVRAGDRVSVHAMPHIEVPLIFWACVHLGAVFVPIATIWSRKVASHILDRCRPKLLFVNDEVGARVPEAWRRHAIRLDPAGDAADPSAAQPVFSDWLGDADATVPAHSPAPDDIAAIFFTSGTTGVPKGVRHSHAALATSSLMIGPATGLGPDAVFFTIVECTSPIVMRNSMVATVMCGATVVIADPARRGNVLGLAEICREAGVTVLRAVPATLRRLGQIGDRIAPGTFDTLRLICANAAPLHQETLDALARLSPAGVTDQMGGTEAPTILLTPRSVHRASILVHGGYTHGIVAQAVDDAGEVIRDGSIGRLRTYGERVMVGYLDDPERTAEVMQDGWYFTGDMARREPDGPMFIAGRAVEMIKSAWGDKVFPSEIETVLMADARVHEAAACGFAAADGGERIAAFVIPDGTGHDPDRLGEELKDRVRQALGDSKVPSVVVLVDEMPRVQREKVNKRELARRYLDPA